MPNPTKQQVHIDRALTNISIAYIQKAETFVAGKVFPIVPVIKQSDRYFVYLKEDWFRDEAEERRRGTESAGGGYRLDNTPNYFCRNYAFHVDVTDEDRANSDEPLKPDEDATEFITQKMLIKRENEWATRFFATSIWSTEYAGVAATPTASDNELLVWTDASSDPILAISNAQVEIQSKTAFKPNKLVLGARVYAALKNHPLILDRIKYTQKGIVTKDLLAVLFDVEEILITEAVLNTNQSDNSRTIAASASAGSVDFLMGNHALLCYAAPSPGIKKPSAGYIFSWKGLLGAGAFGNRMVRVNMPWLGIGTERIEGEIAFDIHLVSADLGCFFKDIV